MVEMTPLSCLLILFPLLLQALTVSGASLSEGAVQGLQWNGQKSGSPQKPVPRNAYTFNVQVSETQKIGTPSPNQDLSVGESTLLSKKQGKDTEKVAADHSGKADDISSDISNKADNSNNSSHGTTVQELNAIQRRDSVALRDAEYGHRDTPSPSSVRNDCNHNTMQTGLTYIKCKIDKAEKTADCSHRGMTKIPQDLPPSLTSLVLSNNCIHGSALSLAPFRKYPNLLSLKLDGNILTNLPDRSFEGLVNLMNLTLYNNSITMNQKLNQSQAFMPLKLLERLILNRNNKYPDSPGLIYPDLALSYLKNLKTLEIDGLSNKAFGPHFSKLENLATLQMSGYKTGFCNLTYLVNSTFINVPNIQTLNISDCNIKKNTAGVSVLEPLKKLQTLDISYNFHLGIDGMGKLMYGQRFNRNLKTLHMNIISERYGPCVVVYKETLRYFRETKLETIEAFHNNIEMIEYEALKLLPKTLKTLDLTRNKIMFGAYWLDLKEMTGLSYIHLDGYDRAFKIPNHFPSEKFHCGPGANSRVQEEDSKLSTIDKSNTDPFLSLSLPPNLKYLTLASYSMSYEIGKLKIDPINKLRHLSLRGNNFPTLTGPIYGLNDLKVLDLSFCSVTDIAENFFSTFSSLRTLNLFGNALGDSWSWSNATERGSFFASDSLKNLDLGKNNIFKLKSKVFKGCSNLHSLKLDDNKLFSLDISPDDLPSLTALDLGQNQMSSLPQALLDHFSKKISSGEKVSIIMSFNPIECDCGNIQFLKWVTQHKVFGPNYKNYYCYDPKRHSSRLIESYDDELNILMKQCADNVPLFICVISATVAFFFILIGVVIYRYRWKMRYSYYTVRAMMSEQTETGVHRNFEYDVFVNYCNQDRGFVEEVLNTKLGTEREVKLMLHDKCFQAGDSIVDSIFKAVQQCRKTLVVISWAMLESQWCRYSIEMALQEANTTARNVLVILLLEKIPSSSMSLDMVHHIRSNVFVSYPSNQEEQEEFWVKLASDLKPS